MFSAEMARVGAALLAVSIALATAAGSASAATVAIEPIYDKAAWTADRVSLRAAPGEVNDVTVAGSTPGTITVTDRVPLEPGRDCVAESALVVRCTARHMFSLQLKVRLDDGDDAFRPTSLHASSARLFGGPGDDRLIGLADAFTSFTGGPGDDRMEGGSQGDTFFEDARRNGGDTLLGGPAAEPGVLAFDDAVVYRQRRRPLRIRLDGKRNDGEVGERDLIGLDVELVVGGSGPDVMIGSQLRNSLSGGPGRDLLRGGAGDDSLVGDELLARLGREEDTIRGGPGDDRLEGGRGADRMSGGAGHDAFVAGPGDDRVDADDGILDAVLCRSGRDRVAHDRADFLTADCERQGSRIPARVLPLFWADAGDRLALVLGCPYRRGRPCRAEATFEVAGQTFGPRAFTLQPGRYGWLFIALGSRTFENPDPPLDGGVVTLSSAGGAVRVPLGDVHRDPTLASFFLPPVLPFL
jgi:hypothetical protein